MTDNRTLHQHLLDPVIGESVAVLVVHADGKRDAARTLLESLAEGGVVRPYSDHEFHCRVQTERLMLIVQDPAILRVEDDPDGLEVRPLDLVRLFVPAVGARAAIIPGSAIAGRIDGDEVVVGIEPPGLDWQAKIHAAALKAMAGGGAVMRLPATDIETVGSYSPFAKKVYIQPTAHIALMRWLGVE